MTIDFFNYPYFIYRGYCCAYSIDLDVYFIFSAKYAASVAPHSAIIGVCDTNESAYSFIDSLVLRKSVLNSLSL